MKKTILLTVIAIGSAVFTVQLTAADAAKPGCAKPACCGDAAKTTTVADTKAKPYPLDICPVSGEKLGEMGAPFTFVYKDQEVKLCCKSCKKDFDKDPEKFLKKLAADKK